MAKKITAPKTYDPGKGRPKEHLAYLNQREMDYLRSINGNNMERGPRGLPSFPPDDAIGSSSRSTSSGNKTGVGGGGGGGGGSTGSRGSSTGSVGSRSGSEAPGNLGGGGKGGTSPSGTRSSPSPGAGGQRGAGSNTGPGSGRPGTTSSRGPSSPMGGQGSSFSSPSAASSYNRDQAAQQRAAVKDAVGAVRSNNALKTDLQVGGIRSLSVGPIGTTVSVPKALTSAVSGTVNPAKTGISQSLKYSSPIGPAYDPENIAELNRQEQELRDFLKYGNPPTPTGSPSMAGAFPTVSTPKGMPSIGYGNFTTPYSGPAPSIGNYVDKYIVDISGSVPEERYSVGEYNVPDALSGAGYGTFNVPDVGFENRLRDVMKPDIEIPAPPSPFGEDERILKVENLPEERPRIAAGTYTSPYDVSSPLKVSKKEQRALDVQYQNLGFDDYQYRQPTEKTLSRLKDVFGQYGLQTPDATNMSTENPMQTDVVDSPYISPTTQMPPEGLPEKTIPEKILGRTSFGQLGRAARWAVGKEYESLTPQERANLMERWANQNAQYLRGQSPVNDRGGYVNPYEFARPNSMTFSGDETKPSTNQPEETGRPQAYYYWDVGVKIPSPGDSDYTLYLKYLDEKAAARAAVS